MRLDDEIALTEARMESLLREAANEKRKLELLKRERDHLPENVAPFLVMDDEGK